MPEQPDEVWVGDFLPWLGIMGLRAVWMDLYSRRIVGWHLDYHMQESLITTAF